MTEAQALQLIELVESVLSEGIVYLAGVIVGSIAALGMWVIWK